MDSVELRVHVPADRETEFYRWFADWRDEVEVPPPAAKANGTDRELAGAIEWWKLLKRNERAIFEAFVEAAPRMVSAETLVKSLGLDGPRAIPGILSWPGRKGKKVDFNVDWRFRHDLETGEPLYGIEDVAFAELIRRARDEVEASR